MKFMLLLKADDATESAATPSDDELNAMGAYNDELIRDGVMVAGEGLHSSASGARIDFLGDNSTVTDGPFTGSHDLIAGFWILQVDSRDEAIRRARKAPLRSGQIEVRQIFDISEFDPNNEYVRREAAWREREAAGQSHTA
jgi:hypothetical protein